MSHFRLVPSKKSNDLSLLIYRIWGWRPKKTIVRRSAETQLSVSTKGKEGVGKPTPFMALCHVGWALAELYMALAMAPSKELCERAVTLCHQLRNRAPRLRRHLSDPP